MSPRLLVLVPVVAALAGSAPAVADQTAKTVTATGNAEVKVVPKNRQSNASIKAAVEAAHRAGIADALHDAHGYALKYAKATGLTLASIVSVSDVPATGVGYYGPGGFFGPFGPNQYCGTIHRAIIKVVNGKRKVVGTKRVHRCIVPPFELTTLTVTYSAN
ncbi:MAG TPA: hypothetical protein VGF93_01320 [Solirubrobacteraceae bacterium]|jgi:uncharacterized protein YggE